MTGPAGISPSPASGAEFSGQMMSDSMMNAQRMQIVTDRLKMAMRSGTSRTNYLEIYSPCIALARGIDFAVANSEVPCETQELPALVKQICERKNDRLLRAAIMVLMASIKNACKLGWFLDKDTEELLNLSIEIGSTFCMPGEFKTERSQHPPVISSIMDRYFPQLKMRQVLAHLAVKPGYGTYLVDFQILKNGGFSGEDKIMLFIGATDNIESSSCIASSKKVNFLLNGKGVDRRMNATMGNSPQIPADVTAMLKFGTNLLQSFGQFEGHYVIALVVVSVKSPLDTPMLQDYVQPVAVSEKLDPDVIEEASRISLSCPISCSRIKTPVKGHSCKHIQCFDFENFVVMNIRRPSWRCPCCNQPVSFLDVRIDQNMVKVLKEVGEDFAAVTISADGSWKPVLDSNNHNDQPHEKNCDSQKDGHEQLDGIIPTDSLNVYDLTEEDYANVADIFKTEDRLPSQQIHSAPSILTASQELNQARQVSQSTTQVQDSTGGRCLSDAQVNDSLAQPSLSIAPVLPDAICPALGQQLLELQEFNYTNLLRSQIPSSNGLQLHFQSPDSILSNEYGRFASVPRQVNHIPIAVQALPASPITPDLRLRSRTTLPNCSSLSQVPVPSQNHSHSQDSFLPTQPVRQASVPIASQLPGNYRMPTGYMRATQQVCQTARQSQQLSVPSQTSHPGQPLMDIVNGSGASVRDQRQTVQQVSRAESLVGSSSEQLWRPAARMRGSLSGRAYSEALHQFMVQPSLPVQSTPPTNPSPPAGLPPQLHALLANNLNIYAPSQTQDQTMTDTNN